MASTSKLKKRKFEEKKKTDIMRMSDRDQGTSESGSIRTCLDGTDKQYEKTIQARCSPTRFVNLCTELKDEFRMAVSEMGFSSLLEMSSCTIFRPLVGWLIKSFNVEDASLCVHGKTFILTPSSFEMVMGVKDGGEDFDQKRSPEDVKRMQDAVKDGNATLSIKQLEENLIVTKSVDELFVARFVLFAVGTLLMPSTSVCVGTSMVGSITGLESVRKKNWATKSFAYLVDAIRDFKKKTGAFVGGCVLFLQVFYLHHLEGHNQYIDRSILPIAAWTEKKSKDIVTWINEGSGYGSKKIQMRETDNGCYKCQSMHSAMINMETKINKCELEIQELRQRVIVLEQSNNSDREVVAGECGGSRIVELFSSDREGVTRESGGDRIGKSHIIVSDDDESESDFHSQSTDQSDISLDNYSIAMYKNFVSSGGQEIGRFKLTQPFSCSDSKKIAMYIFDESLDKKEVIVQFGHVQLSRAMLIGPLTQFNFLWEEVLDAYASLLNDVVGMQYEIPDNRECWFLPISLSWVAHILGLERLLDEMDYYNKKAAEWRKYLGNLAKCTKIVIPVFLLFHMLTAVVNLREENVVLWEFLPIPPQRSEEAAIETLRILDHLLADDIKKAFPNGLSLESFQLIHQTSQQQLDGKNDDDIYVMKQMWAVSKGLDNIPKFNPKEFLLEVYIELVQSQFNEVRPSVLEKCSSHFKSLERATKRAGKRKIKF